MRAIFLVLINKELISVSIVNQHIEGNFPPVENHDTQLQCGHSDILLREAQLWSDQWSEGEIFIFLRNAKDFGTVKPNCSGNIMIVTFT